MTVTVITRENCGLCQAAERIVAQVSAEHQATVELVDVDADPELAHLSDEVPVVLVDGVRHAYWTVDPAALATAITGVGRRSSRPADGMK